jgi:tetratricopeptide (TPR) repeat protein
LLFAILALAAFGAGLYAFALRQWTWAEVALSEDQPAEALDRLSLCLRIWPRSPEVHLLAARAALLSGDLDAAESHLNQCLRLQNGATEMVQLHFLLLRALSGEVDEVGSVLVGFVEDNHPQTPLILEILSRAYMRRLHFKEAYACLTRWTEETLNLAKPFAWRGWVLERMDSLQDAIVDYRKALNLNPKLSWVRLRLAEMLLDDKKPVEALPHLEQLYRETPEKPEVQARLGQCRLFQGRQEEARRLLEAAAEKLPNDLALLVDLAKLELQTGRAAEAERWVRQSLEVDPFDMESEFILVSCLQGQGREAEAAAALEKYTKDKARVQRANEMLAEEATNPSKDPARASELGILLLSIRKEQLGIHWLEEALALEPEQEAAHRALAEYYEQKGQGEKAVYHRRRLPKTGTTAAGPIKK